MKVIEDIRKHHVNKTSLVATQKKEYYEVE